MATCLNSQSLLELQTYPDHNSVPPSKLQGLLLQYIEDQKHQFPANLLYSTHLYSSDFLQGQYTFRVCKPDKNCENEAITFSLSWEQWLPFYLGILVLPPY